MSKLHRDRIATVKQQIQQKLAQIEEERNNIVQQLNDLVSANKELARPLLEMRDKSKADYKLFFKLFEEMSPQLEKSYFKLLNLSIKLSPELDGSEPSESQDDEISEKGDLNSNNDDLDANDAVTVTSTSSLSIVSNTTIVSNQPIAKEAIQMRGRREEVDFEIPVEDLVQIPPEATTAQMDIAQFIQNIHPQTRASATELKGKSREDLLNVIKDSLVSNQPKHTTVSSKSPTFEFNPKNILLSVQQDLEKEVPVHDFDVIPEESLHALTQSENNTNHKKPQISSEVRPISQGFEHTRSFQSPVMDSKSSIQLPLSPPDSFKGQDNKTKSVDASSTYTYYEDEKSDLPSQKDGAFAANFPCQNNSTTLSISSQIINTAVSIPNQNTSTAVSIPNQNTSTALSIPNQNTSTALSIPNQNTSTALSIPFQNETKFQSQSGNALLPLNSQSVNSQQIMKEESPSFGIFLSNQQTQQQLISYGKGQDPYLPNLRDSFAPATWRKEINLMNVPISDAKHKGKIVHVISFNHFFINLCNEESLKMEIQLRNRLLNADVTQSMMMLQPRDYCLFVNDSFQEKKRYRCRVMNKTSKKLARVFFVDYGYVEEVEVFRLVPLDESLYEICQQVIQCSLNTELDIDGEDLSHFKHMFNNKGYKPSVTLLEKSPKSVYRVQLNIALNGWDFDMLQYFEVKKNAVSAKKNTNLKSIIPSQQTIAKEYLPVDLPLRRKYKPELVCTSESESVSSVKKIPSANKSPTKHSSSNSSEQSETQEPKFEWRACIPTISRSDCQKDDSTYYIIISLVINPSEIYVHYVSEPSTHLDELQKEMNNFYSKLQLSKPVYNNIYPHIGTFWSCQIPNNPDKNWYRVKVLSLIEDITSDSSTGARPKNSFQRNPRTPILVQNIDYGDKFEICLRDLRPLTKRFTELPGLAVPCSLFNLQPMSGENSTWTAASINTLIQMTGFKDTLSMEIVNELGNGRFEVVLFNKVVCFNLLMVEKNMAALKISAEEMENLQLDFWDPMKAEFFNARNNYDSHVDDAGVALTGHKAEDEKYTCRYYSFRKRCPRGDKCQYLHIDQTVDGATMDQCEIFTVTQLALPRRNTSVYLQISASYNPGHFYVIFPYGVEANSETINGGQFNEPLDLLPELERRLNEYYEEKSIFRENTSLKLALGTCVVAKSISGDNCWHRAIIHDEISNEEDHYKVFYMDYGNYEWVPRSFIRMIDPQFIHIPQQAVECFLANIVPAGNKWSPEAKNFFRLMTEGQILVAEVLCTVGESLCIYVNLHVKKDGNLVLINTALLNEGFAEPCSDHLKLPKVKRNQENGEVSKTSNHNSIGKIYIPG